LAGRVSKNNHQIVAKTSLDFLAGGKLVEKRKANRFGGCRGKLVNFRLERFTACAHCQPGSVQEAKKIACFLVALLGVRRQADCVFKMKLSFRLKILW